MKRIKHLLTFSLLICFCISVNAEHNNRSCFSAGFTEIKADTTFRNLTVFQADSLIDSNAYNPDFIIIDLRTPSDYNAGHINNAININYYATDFDTSLDTLDKTKIYLIYCQGGSRSGQTFTKMRIKHFVVVYNMSSGFSAWLTAGYPYVTNTTEIENEYIVPNEVNIYPNPASQYFFIETNELVSSNTIVEMYDLNGKNVMTKLFSSRDKIQIYVGEFIQGIYFYRIVSKDLPPKNGKVMIKN